MLTNTSIRVTKLSSEVVQILNWGSVSSVLSLPFLLKFNVINLGAGIMVISVQV